MTRLHDPRLLARYDGQDDIYEYIETGHVADPQQQQAGSRRCIRVVVLSMTRSPERFAEQFGRDYSFDKPDLSRPYVRAQVLSYGRGLHCTRSESEDLAYPQHGALMVLGVHYS